MIWTRRFWKDAFERAIKSFAQGCLSLLTIDMTMLDVDWYIILSAGGFMSVYSLLTSVASAPVGQKDSGSILK